MVKKRFQYLIDGKLIDLEVKDEKIKVSDEEVDDELATFVESTGGEEAFKAALRTKWND